MKIGIIGSTLARKLGRAGHSLLIANSRGPDTLHDLANETGARAVTAEEATRDVDVVILSIPFGKLPLLRDLFAGLPKDVIVADTSNYFPFRDGQIPTVDDGQVESLWVSEQIGHPVIKVWNNILAATLRDKGMPAGAEGRIALSVAGDGPVGKQTVMSRRSYRIRRRRRRLSRRVLAATTYHLRLLHRAGCRPAPRRARESRPCWRCSAARRHG